MSWFKKVLLNLCVALYIWLILMLPRIGMILYIDYNWWWVDLILITISYILLDLYGKYYFNFNRDDFKTLTKLKIHHDVENNDVWIESNEVIDSIIDIDIVKHVNLDKNV